jgi:Domain of unknown function (DUF4132)/HEAT repeats
MPLMAKGHSDVPRAWAAALKQVLEFVDPTGEVATFVLTGQPVQALGHFKSGARSIRDRTRWSSDAAKKALATLYAGFGDLDAAVLRRWGRVLDAARGTFVWGQGLGDVAGGHWPELMLQQAAAGTPSGPLPFTFADLERIAEQDGTPPADLVRMAFILPPYSRYQGQTVLARQNLSRLPGFADAVVAHRDIAATALASGSVDERVATASLLGMLGDTPLSALAGPLAGAATSTSAQVRAAIRPLIDRIGDAAIDPLRALATGGEPERRVYALEFLAARPDQRAWAVKTADADRAASVRALSARWAAAGTPPAGAGEEVLPELPPLPSWSLAAADAERTANQVFEAVRRGIESQNRSMRALSQRHPNHPQFRGIPEPSRDVAARVAGLLAAAAPAGVDARLAGIPTHGPVMSQLTGAIQQYGYSASTVIQLMAILGWLEHRYYLWPGVIEEMHARTGGPDLLTLQQMFDAVGIDGRASVWSAYSASWGTRIGRDWPDEHVWPFVARNLAWIVEESSRHSWNRDDQAFFAAVATLPRPPARLVDHLYSLALGAGKTDRASAQEALERDPQRTARAAAALQDGKSDIRLAAAQWLARIADPSALPALSAAWKQEKQDVVRGAVLDALIAIGEDAESYLDPAKTAAAAAKFVAKGLPSALGWLDWETVPGLTWASSGEAVPRAVVQWLCGTAVKAKSPEPDAVLRHYTALFDAAERERLAVCLLTGWLREDVRPVPPAEAESMAARAASVSHRWHSSPSGPYPGMSVEQVKAILLPGYLKIPAGSAVASKGLLAVVAACGGRDVVPPSERYLKEWYGQRAAQGKALIGMLAWVDHPNAIQLVLAVSSRFRTKSFQDEAVRQAGALAGRKGWTVDELADRTIPTAGFDDHGVLELPYGPRTFTAVLRPDLTVELRDPEGKAIKALPAPRQSDDEQQAKESKKALSAAKKDLKNIATLQAQRLYEAMCTERSWSAEDWERYLLRHPVVGPAVRRLVWVAPSDDGRSVVFRPLDDGSLTDVDDNDVELPDGARVKVAHDSVLSSDEVAQWTAHLADYEVVPLFQQLGRGVHAVSPRMRSKRELTDFTGSVLEAFALRGRAGKLGYVRGQTEDAGWFYTYEKRFPTLGIVAVANFTGNPLPEENRLVALKELTFRREVPGGHGTPLALGDVPAVLVSECWQDMRLLAAEGTGFDPEWEKKTGF